MRYSRTVPLPQAASASACTSSGCVPWCSATPAQNSLSRGGGLSLPSRRLVKRRSSARIRRLARPSPSRSGVAVAGVIEPTPSDSMSRPAPENRASRVFSRRPSSELRAACAASEVFAWSAGGCCSQLKSSCQDWFPTRCTLGFGPAGLTPRESRRVLTCTLARESSVGGEESRAPAAAAVAASPSMSARRMALRSLLLRVRRRSMAAALASDCAPPASRTVTTSSAAVPDFVSSSRARRRTRSW